MSLFAQVGINTETPDTSSILDVTATDAGVLVPRLSTTQMNAIATPATGLYIFNTTENDFYFYDGTSWVTIGSKQLPSERTNFKLVQSVADLADEDTGSNYVLNTNTLYEVNGTVVIDKPIDLNGAYITGVDTTEDILANGTGSALFAGSEGGSIRSLTISSTGFPVFDINDTTGDQILLFTNSIITGASSVGTLNGLNLVFLSINQFLGNTNGLTITDISTLLISNVFWTATNNGTFLNATGTFDNFQIANGRIEVDSGETGLNVSSNPTIVNTALLGGLSFVGDGDFVDGYTTGTYPGFNFDNNWNVRCAGIPNETDENASANFYSDSGLTTGFTQLIASGTSREVQGNGSFTATNLFRFSAVGGNNDLIYEGREARSVQVNASLSVRVSGAVGEFYAFAIARNGTIVTETNSVVQISSNTQIQNIALNGVLQLEPNDRVELFVQRLTDDGSGSDTDTLGVFSENLSIR